MIFSRWTTLSRQTVSHGASSNGRRAHGTASHRRVPLRKATNSMTRGATTHASMKGGSIAGGGFRLPSMGGCRVWAVTSIVAAALGLMWLAGCASSPKPRALPGPNSTAAIFNPGWNMQSHADNSRSGWPAAPAWTPEWSATHSVTIQVDRQGHFFGDSQGVHRLHRSVRETYADR